MAENNENPNNIDPDGIYATRRHWNNSSINWSARGLKVNDLWGVGSYQSIDTNYSFTQLSQFPYNQVNETPGGHVIEYEDTPGQERLLIKHKSGTGIDMRADGSIIISTRKNRMEYVTGDETLIIDGDATLVYGGNLKMEVAGDWDVNVGGDFNLDVGGQRKQTIKGSDIKRVEKNINEVVVENKSTKIMGSQSSIVKEDRVDVTGGIYDMLVDDKASFTIGDDLRISSTSDINVASENFQTVSEKVGIISTSGTIGGEAVEHFGKTYSGPADGGGSGTSFIGSLVGIAAESITSRYAVYTEQAHHAFVSRYALKSTGLTNVPVPYVGVFSRFTPPDYQMAQVNRYVENRPEYNMPTSSIVDGILRTTDKGIVELQVFGDDIENLVTLTKDYEGKFFSDPTADEIRHAPGAVAAADLRGLSKEWGVGSTDTFSFDPSHDTNPANDPPWEDN